MTEPEDPFAAFAAFKVTSTPADVEAQGQVAPTLSLTDYRARLPAQTPSSLHIKVAQLSAPSLLWHDNEPLTAGRESLKETWAAIEAIMPAASDEEIAIAAAINVRITSAQLLARKAQRSKRSKAQPKELDPVADFVQLAYRWSRRGDKAAKVRPLSPAEQIRMGTYWHSENQNVFAQAYKKYLTDLKNAHVAGEEIDRLHQLLMRHIEP